MPKKPRSIIVHLRINSSSLEDYIEYDPNITEPDPVSTSSTVPFNKYSRDEDTYVEESKAISAPSSTTESSNKINGVFMCNKEHIGINMYPRGNSTVCWWDGHPFDCAPFYIPKRKLEDDSYSIYGNFCSPECAMAYLWNDGNIDNETRWERSSLMCQFKKEVYKDTSYKISKALPRWTLKEYGGKFTIDEYRKIHTSTTSDTQVFYPPVTADIPIVRVKNILVNPRDAPIKPPVVIHDDRIRKAEENLQSKRESSKEEYTGYSGQKVLPTGGLASMMKIRVVDT